MRAPRIAWCIALGLMVVAACAKPPSDDSTGPYAGSPLHGQAPEFELVDQFGSQVRLIDFRGRVVALTFLDSRCRDVCPLTSAELIAAWFALTPQEQDRVALLGVNVNAEANRVENVARASEAWRLAEIPAWRFLTGSSADLGQVWQAYPVEVQPRGPGEAISHTSGIFLIDGAGNLRWYVSVPLEDPAWDGPRLAEILVLRLRGLLEAE